MNNSNIIKLNAIKNKIDLTKTDEEIYNQMVKTYKDQTLKTYINTLYMHFKTDFWYDKKNQLRKSCNDEDMMQGLSSHEVNKWISLDKINVIRNICKDNDQEYLLFSLLVLQPPLRNDFYTNLKYTDNLNNVQNSNTNYICIDNDNYYYVVNKDKVSNKKAFKNLKNIKILNDELKEIIKRNFKNNESVFKIMPIKILNKYNLTFNICRSAYITDFYNNTDNKLVEYVNLSELMRHDWTTAFKNYYKRDIPNNEISINEEHIKDNLKKNNKSTPIKITDTETNEVNIYQSKYSASKKLSVNVAYIFDSIKNNTLLMNRYKVENYDGEVVKEKQSRTKMDIELKKQKHRDRQKKLYYAKKNKQIVE